MRLQYQRLCGGTSTDNDDDDGGGPRATCPLCVLSTQSTHLYTGLLQQYSVAVASIHFYGIYAYYILVLLF